MSMWEEGKTTGDGQEGKGDRVGGRYDGIVMDRDNDNDEIV